jgi:hypothetical protein
MMATKLNDAALLFWTPVYDDPPASDTSSDSDTTVVTSKSTQAGTTTDDTSSDPKPTTGKIFTEDQQKQVDKIVEKRVAKMKTEQQKAIDQLNTLKKTTDMTVEERDKLQERITSLEESMMTKEEIAAKNRKEAELKHQTEVQTLEQQLAAWKARYSDSTIERSILDAAANTADDNPAINPSQIVTILRGNTHLVENTVDGTGTGEFVPRVKFMGRDSENKPMQMDLTVPEAITEMKKMENEYGNLWKSGLTGGVGSNNTPGTGALTDSVLDSQEAYMKERKRIKETI